MDGRDHRPSNKPLSGWRGRVGQASQTAPHRQSAVPSTSANGSIKALQRRHQKRDKPEFSKPSMTGSSRPAAVGAVRSATPALNALGSSAASKSLTGLTSTLSAPAGSDLMMSSTYG